MSLLSKDYLRYTFFFMLLGWGSCLIFSACGFSLSQDYGLYIPYLLGGMSPTIASFLSLKKNRRIHSVKEWIKQLFDFRHGLFSYLLPVVFSVLYILPQCWISGYTNGAPLPAILIMIPMMLFGGGLEEAGWRRILQREFEKKYSFTLSTLLTGIIWWLWHLTLFFIQGAAQYGQNYFLFGINVLGLSFALASIRKVTHSVWLCILFHCIINSLMGIYLIQASLLGNTASAILLTASAYLVAAMDLVKNIPAEKKTPR